MIMIKTWTQFSIVGYYEAHWYNALTFFSLKKKEKKSSDRTI